MAVYGKDKRELVEELRELRTHLDGLERRNAELIQAERELYESMEQFKTILEDSPLGLYRTTPDGRILMANSAVVKMLGYSSFEELAWRNLEKEGYEPQYSRSQFKHRIEQEGKVIGLESAWKKSDGTTLFVRESAQAVRDESGHILYYQGTVEDITERKQAEEALRMARDELETQVQQRTAELQRANEVLQAQIAESSNAERQIRERARIIDTTTDSVVMTDCDGVITMWNRGAERIFGYTSQEMIGRLVGTLYPEQQQGRLAEIVQTLLRGEEIATAEVTCVRKDGSPVELALSVLPIKDDVGNVTNFVGISKDITERKKAQEELREHEEMIRALVETSRDWIWSIDVNSVHTYCNPAVEQILGYSPDELVGRQSLDLVHDDDRRMIEESLPICIAEKRGWSNLLIRWRHKDGTYRYLESNAVPILGSENTLIGFRGVDRDITERKMAEESLRESEERFRKVFEEGPIGMVLTSRDLKFFSANPAFCKMLGYTMEEMSSKTFLDVTHPAHRDADRQNVEKMWRGEVQRYMTEKRYLAKDGDVHWGSLSTSLIRGQDGEPLYALAMVEDITERKRAQEFLRETTALLETIFAHTHILVAYLDPQFNFVRVNRAYAEADGREPSFFTGRNHFDLYPNAENEAIFRKVVDSGVPYFAHAKPFEYAEHPERGVTYWDWSLMPIKRQEGAVCGLVLTLADVTEQKRAEQTLLEREATLTSIFRTAPVGIGLECDRVLVRVNDQVCSMLGYSREELIGQRAVMFYPTEDHYERVRQENRPQILEKGAATVETQWKRKDGRIVDVLLGTTVLDPSDFAKGVTFTALDITERKAAEEAVRESEEKFRSLADQSPNMIFINKKGRIVYANRSCEEIMGYTREEFYSPDFDFLTLFEPESVDAIKGYFARHLRGQEVESYDSCMISRTGQRIEAISTCKLIQYEGETAILGIVTDITERKKAEQALRESQERLKILFESAPDAIYLIDPEGRFVDGNRAAFELIGFARDEVIGRCLAELDLLSAEQLSQAEVNISKVIAGKLSGPNEYILKRKDDSFVSVEVRTFPVKIAGKMLTLGIARDITEHKQTEKKLLEHQAELKSLTSQLSLTEERERHRLATDLHDQISQSLVISKIKLDQLCKSSVSSEFNKSLEDISKCLGQIIDDTRALTFDLSYPILYELGFEAAVAEWLADQIQEKHGIKTEFVDDGHDKPLDDDIRVLLFRNVRELLVNVVKHARAHKVIVAIHKVNKHIKVTVEDDGVGFDPVEVASMAAKRAEFGLFSIRERLEQLCGRIEIHSEPGRGSRITMIAPLKYDNSKDEIEK